MSGITRSWGKRWIKRLLADGLQQFLFPASGQELKKKPKVKQGLLPIGYKSPKQNTSINLHLLYLLVKIKVGSSKKIEKEMGVTQPVNIFFHCCY